MDWTDEGIVLSVRTHGETSALVELMTRGHGRHLGIVRGGRSRTARPLLQAGNRLQAHWRARLDEHLGNFTVEGLDLAAGRLMASRAALFGLGNLVALARLLPERDPHPAVYQALGIVIEHLDDAATAAALMVRFELAMLSELGFGLDLSSCAATGEAHDLAYVSPKSGRAVGRDAGAAYAGRLLTLPAFLVGSGPNAAPTVEDVAAVFRLTGHFLSRHVYEARGMAEPEARAAFIAASLADR